MLTESNHEMIVPNKTLLDEQVTNLTLSDEFVRRVVIIDVDRTRPVLETKRRMQELAFFHPLVIKSPSPVVLLTEVDSYALRFEVHIWMEHRSFLKCGVIQSEILESITAEFPPLDEASASPAVSGTKPQEEGAAKTHEDAVDSPPETSLEPASNAEDGARMLLRIGKLGRAAVQRELKRNRLK